MSTIIIITPPPKKNVALTAEEDTTIKVKLDGDGSVADQLRQAADVIDGKQ